MRDPQNLIVVKKDMIKLIRKNLQNEFDLDRRLFTPIPCKITDEIFLYITYRDLQYLYINSLLSADITKIHPLI